MNRFGVFIMGLLEGREEWLEIEELEMHNM